MQILLGAITNALNSVLPQLAALLTFTAADYGRFALLYLAFALANSFLMSTVCEPWARTGRKSERADYSAAQSVIVTVGVIGGLVGALVLQATWPAVGMGAAMLAVNRVGNRYYLAATGRHLTALTSELAAAASLLIAWGILFFRMDAINALLLAWLVSGMVGTSCAFYPTVSIARAWRWQRTHRSSIRLLLSDSLLLDAGTIGVPALLGPWMGLAQFGVFRAASSAALPNRLILTPARPYLGAPGMIEKLLKPRGTASIMISGVTIGSAVALVLYFASRINLQGDVLSHLAEYWAVIGMFVASNFIDSMFYFMSRVQGSARTLLKLRAASLLAAIIFLPGGYLLLGLEGAIWGMLLQSLVTASCYQFGLRLAVSKGQDPA